MELGEPNKKTKDARAVSFELPGIRLELTHLAATEPKMHCSLIVEGFCQQINIILFFKWS